MSTITIHEGDIVETNCCIPKTTQPTDWTKTISLVAFFGPRDLTGIYVIFNKRGRKRHGGRIRKFYLDDSSVAFRCGEYFRIKWQNIVPIEKDDIDSAVPKNIATLNYIVITTSEQLIDCAKSISH